MFIIKALLVTVILLGIPVILGDLITGHMEEQYKGHLVTNWVFGMALMFAQLQIVAVPMIIKDQDFHSLLYVYVSVILIEMIYVLSRRIGYFLGLVKLIPSKLKKGGIIGALVILCILMQGGMLSYFVHPDDDDARYIPSAVAAVEKDIMFEENPITGVPLYSRISEVFKDMVSPWIMFWAIVSKITAIQPAILMHTVVPVFFIPLSYAVYWILSGCLFKEEHDKKLIFLGLVCLINIFSGYSVFNAGSFLLLRIWQGKALFASIFVPLLFALAIRFYNLENKKLIYEYITIALICCGACLTSGFGIILTAIFLGLFSVVYGLGKKDFKGMAAIWFSMLPCVIYGFLYAFGARLFM